ncbi:MAG: hypothetical protein LBJ64_11285, partial [Deltaproteobacteria bacterium]|nr:hypothetical protein [Deltaproteobacteria bacterium]
MISSVGKLVIAAKFETDTIFARADEAAGGDERQAPPNRVVERLDKRPGRSWFALIPADFSPNKADFYFPSFPADARR